MKVRVAPEAHADIAEARLWYRQRAPGLDVRFVDAVESCLGAISRHPERGPVVEGTIRRVLLRGFPYSIFYSLSANDAVVLACLHGARSPRVWRRRRVV